MCVYCCEDYRDPAAFRKHMQAEHDFIKIKNAFTHCNIESYLKIDITDLNCRLCSEKFDKVDVIARHLAEKHDIEINFGSDLGVHPYKLLQEKIMCGICDHNFPCVRQVSRHMAVHFQNFNCDFCGKAFGTKSTLQQHLRFLHLKEEGIICRRCKQTFKTGEEKRDHVANSPKCWLYVCGGCNLRFANWNLKEEHLMKVHGKAKQTHPCSECDKSFDTRKQYKAHFNTTHADDKLICSICGMLFATKRNLDRHGVLHTGVKDYQCSVCSKTFFRKTNLTEHMWIHSDVKRFECKPCKKKFNQKVCYTSHMKVHHSSVKIEDNS